jgi:hypothetical protein
MKSRNRNNYEKYGNVFFVTSTVVGFISLFDRLPLSKKIFIVYIIKVLGTMTIIIHSMKKNILGFSVILLSLMIAVLLVVRDLSIMPMPQVSQQAIVKIRVVAMPI